MQIKTALGPTLDQEALDPDKLDLAIDQTRRDLALARLKAAPEEADDTARGILAREVGRLGDHLRLRGDLEESEALLVEVIGLWRALDRPRAEALASLRLALVFRAGSRYNEARCLLSELLEAAEKHKGPGVYRDFILHERGITAWRQGQVGAAIIDLEAALALRIEAGARRLVKTTETALAVIRAASQDPI